MKIDKDTKQELYRLGVLFSDIINIATVGVGMLYFFWGWQMGFPIMHYGGKALSSIYTSVGVFIIGIIRFLSGRNYFKNLGIKIVTTYIWSCSITIIIGIVLEVFNLHANLFYGDIYVLLIISTIIFLIRFVGENYSEMKKLCT